jgi:TonB family protein
MKRTIVAILALSPVLLHAQAKAPAQPGSTPVLQSSNIQPAALAAVRSTAATAAPAPVRTSTGVTPPQILRSVDLEPTSSPSENALSKDKTVVIELTVDPAGKPADLKVVKSADPITDRRALKAVSQFVYKPATLDGSPISMPVTLSLNIQ